MGSSYTNITLRSTDRDAIIAALQAQGRTAYVSPSANGCTVVYDEACEMQDAAIVTALAGALSRVLNCAALAMLNHDDDVLAYWLYDSGVQTDHYNSWPGFSGDDSDDPAGGDAAILCQAFGVTGAAVRVEAILRTPNFPHEERYVFAMDRHNDLVTALGTPDVAVGFGYEYLSGGEFPDGADADSFTHVGGAS